MLSNDNITVTNETDATGTTISITVDDGVADEDNVGGSDDIAIVAMA